MVEQQKNLNYGLTFFAKLKNFFAKLIFFPPKLFLVFWKRKIFPVKKKFGGKKINLAKKFLTWQKPFCLKLFTNNARKLL
jgi:hypothetical protein